MKTRFILLCCGIMMLSACATTEVVTTWKDDSQTQKFSKILVLVVVKEPAYRRLVEHKLVDILQQAGAVCPPSAVTPAHAELASLKTQTPHSTMLLARLIREA